MELGGRGRRGGVAVGPAAGCRPTRKARSRLQLSEGPDNSPEPHHLHGQLKLGCLHVSPGSPGPTCCCSRSCSSPILVAHTLALSCCHTILIPHSSVHPCVCTPSSHISSPTQTQRASECCLCWHGAHTNTCTQPGPPPATANSHCSIHEFTQTCMARMHTSSSPDLLCHTLTHVHASAHTHTYTQHMHAHPF